MLDVPITAPMRKKAKYHADKLGELKNSITKGEGNIIGFLGEVIYLETFGGVWSRTYDYDIITTNELYADVKSKRCKDKPKDHYECSVSAYNTQQDCDIYIFTRIKEDLKMGWILGWMYKEEYFEIAKFLKRGTLDESNFFRVKADCYNLPINKLYNFVPDKEKKK